MGEIIRKAGAADDIISDLRATLASASAKGGSWKTLAEEQLGRTLSLVDVTEARMAQAEDHAAPLVAALDAKDDEADRLVGRIWDEIWNEVGRPAADPALAILFPGGIAYYADGDVDGQPDRMDLLAELLDSNGHPRLAPAVATSLAKRVRASASGLRAAVVAARAPSARVELLQRVRRAIATTARGLLAKLKRTYKVQGFSETDIRSVIPDRTASRGGTPPNRAPPRGAAA